MFTVIFHRLSFLAMCMQKEWWEQAFLGQFDLQETVKGNVFLTESQAKSRTFGPKNSSDKNHDFQLWQFYKNHNYYWFFNFKVMLLIWPHDASWANR